MTTADGASTHRILVVDDDPSIRRILRMLLTKQSYEVLVADSGHKALELAGASPPDLYILDVMMPEMDGFEVCQQLISQGQAGTPVIFLSAKSEVEDRIRGLDLGAVDFVSKPFNAQELLARVRASLRNSCGHQAALKKLERIEVELDLAGQIQMSLMPKREPEFEGLDVHGKTVPVGAIGGDYFDYVERIDNCILLIGDVSGKGIPAALVMVMARTFLNHWDVNLVDTRMSMLALNRLLYTNTDAGIFMSMLMLKWDVDNQLLRYTGAGHEHLLVYRAADRGIEVIKTGGQVLGLREDIISNLSERDLPFAVGDVILVYTDGVTEAMNADNEEYGRFRLNELFGQLCAEALTANEITERIFASLDTFTAEAPQSDDITVMTVRRV